MNSSISINEMCADINRYSPDNNLLYTAINLTDYFFQHKFHGKECDLIQHEYAYHMCVSILKYMTTSKAKKEIEVHENKMNRFLNDAKGHTKKLRHAIFSEWFKCINSNTTSENEAVSYLIASFKNISLWSDVKDELGLNNKVETI